MTSFTMTPQIVIVMIVFVRLATGIIAAVTLRGVSYFKVGDQLGFAL